MIGAMRVLMLGDVVGRPGRRVLEKLLPIFRVERQIDFVVANGENSAGGAGITPKVFQKLLSFGVDVVTSGNHIYRQREILGLLGAGEERLIRPANYPPRAAGRGMTVKEDATGRRVGVLNLQGRVYMAPTEDPFATAEAMIEELFAQADVILVDVHGEATSEKQAMGHFLDGRVAAVVGTHTHVPTADAKILNGGTAYVTDLGMCGPHDSCLGVQKEIIVRKFLTGMPARFEVAEGDVRMQGVIVEVDERTGLAASIERVDEALPE
jgi:metallophosphoesterase (TIGR00282 family)